MHPFYAPYGVYRDNPNQWFDLTDNAKKVRRYLEDYYIERGRGPNVAQIAKDLELNQNQTWHALYQLERGVQVMLVPGTENIVKMPPFSDVATRHKVTVDGESKWYAGCAGESCAINAMFPGKTVTIESMCPDCWEPIKVETKDRTLLSLQPEGALLHIGIHPDKFREDWNVTCDSINFFIDSDHVAKWETALPEKRGATMPVAQGLKWVDGVATTRYWNYDRGPDVGAGPAMLDGFREMGIDVSKWED